MAAQQKPPDLKRKSKRAPYSLVIFHTERQHPYPLACARALLRERIVGGGMSEQQQHEDQHPRWPDFTWIALLVMAILLTGFMLWQGEQTNIGALLGAYEP